MKEDSCWLSLPGAGILQFCHVYLFGFPCYACASAWEARFTGMEGILGGCSTLIRAMALERAWLVEWKGEKEETFYE